MGNDMAANDSLLLLGCGDDKLKKFLQKMGYDLHISNEGEELPAIVGQNLIDLIYIDNQIAKDAVELCAFLRGQENTKEIPIVYLTENCSDRAALAEYGIDGIEFIDAPCGTGSLASKIATQLRMRKMRGEDETKASLSEMNAALRDLNNRFTKELEDARKIQQSLLPKKLPQLPGLEIAASYEPLEEVGGDWFYVEKRESGKLSVQIADVTGHGLSAAFIGSITKLALKAADCDLPHELMEEMNRLMAPQMLEGKFVTMFSYLVDPQTGTLDYARAGHPPGLHLDRKTGKVSQLLGDGFAVGFFEEAEYTHEQTTLGEDDLFLVMTDALPESQNMAGEYYGFDRMSTLLEAMPKSISPTEVISEVITDFEKFRNGRLLKDDVTLIVLKKVSS